MFSTSGNPFLTFLQSYHVWVTSKIQVNFRFRRYWWFCETHFWKIFSIYVFEVNFRYKRHSKVLMIASYEYLKFLQYLYFRGQGINFWYFFELPCSGDLENPGQLSVQEVHESSDDCILWIFWNFFSNYVFEVKESISDIPTELPYLSDLKNLGQLPVQEVVMILLSNVWNFTTIYVF